MQKNRAMAGLWILLTAQIGASADVIAPASERYVKGNQEVPHFQKHVIPLMGRLGCNAAKCHGSFQGKGGFRLSLFGFDFEKDHAELTAKDRVKKAMPEQSLLIQKPSRQVPHKGGRRFDKGSWEHHLLRQWIEAGAKSVAKPQRLIRLDVQPKEVILHKDGDQARLKVIALWSNGAREDVTCLCRFRSNDDAVATVDEDGHIVGQDRGDTHVVAFYDNGVVAIPVIRPVGKARRATPEEHASAVDRHVDAKLAKLGIIPSALCTDAEFLRRVSIDMTGTLPTPLEVKTFLKDSQKDKRARKIEELLKRPSYAAWWANKLCDFTGCSPTAITNVSEVGQATAAQWYDWIYRRVADNVPYDKLVSGIVLANGRKLGQSREGYNKEMSEYVRRGSTADFSDRATMPHYWTRQTVKEPKDKALAFAHSFLGIQLQCAQCHKHPFDSWTQKDFKNFTGFFDTVGVAGGRVGFPGFAAAQAGRIINWPELRIYSGEKKDLTLLRSHTVSLKADDDPRAPIMKWMKEKNNPWFARAFVNRVWAGYFHSGIVSPPDALTPANPPSNPQLLKYLTQGFINNKFNMKWLHRQITSSETYQRSWKPNATNRHDRRNFSRAIPRRIPAEVIYDAMKQITAAPKMMDTLRNNLKRRAVGHLSMRMAGTHAMNVFGKPERSLNCDCERVNEPSLLQAMFLQNDPLVRMRLAESTWIEEINDMKSVKISELIRAAFLRTVNRPPTKAEVKRITEHLKETKSLAEGITDLLWALMNTKEFILNH